MSIKHPPLYDIWISKEPVDYLQALERMEKRVSEILEKKAPPTLWLLQHDPVYTAGKRTASSDFKNASSIPLHQVERGGKLTYHGPGQLIGYSMVDLRHQKDIHSYIQSLEKYVIAILKSFQIPSSAHREKIGIWTQQKNQPSEKIASIGIKVRKWIASHGFALNVTCDLEPFKNITPCGLKNDTITSMKQLNPTIKFEDVLESAEKLGKKFLETK